MTTISASSSDQAVEIQSAIDALAATGGGKVVLEAGEHPCGALRLRDHTGLHLEAGAVLRLTQIGRAHV